MSCKEWWLRHKPTCEMTRTRRWAYFFIFIELVAGFETKVYELGINDVLPSAIPGLCAGALLGFVFAVWGDIRSPAYRTCYEPLPEDPLSTEVEELPDDYYEPRSPFSIAAGFLGFAIYFGFLIMALFVFSWYNFYILAGFSTEAHALEVHTLAKFTLFGGILCMYFTFIITLPLFIWYARLPIKLNIPIIKRTIEIEEEFGVTFLGHIGVGVSRAAAAGGMAFFVLGIPGFYIGLNHWLLTEYDSPLSKFCVSMLIIGLFAFVGFLIYMKATSRWHLVVDFMKAKGLMPGYPTPQEDLSGLEDPDKKAQEGEGQPGSAQSPGGLVNGDGMPADGGAGVGAGRGASQDPSFANLANVGTGYGQDVEGGAEYKEQPGSWASAVPSGGAGGGAGAGKHAKVSPMKAYHP